MQHICLYVEDSSRGSVFCNCEIHNSVIKPLLNFGILNNTVSRDKGT